MAPVILATVVHCEECAKKMKKAVKGVPGVKRVKVTVESGHVEVEGTADAEALRARLQARVMPVPVTIVSDGAGQAEVIKEEAASSSSPPRRPAPAPPLVLEMKLHCDSCAGKVKKLAMEIPGVKSVSTNVNTRRVEVVGTADASTVATTIGISTKRSVKVISDSGGTGFPGYKHERPKKAAAAARATTTQQTEQKTVAAAEDGSASPVLTPIRLDPRLRIVEPTSPPPAQATDYPGPGGWYSVQHWTAPEPTPYPAPCYYPGPAGQGEAYGGVQDWWQTPYPMSGGYNYSDYGPPGERVHGQNQQNDDENAGSKCSIQ